MENIVIYTPYECVIKYKDKEEYLNDEQHLIIDKFNDEFIYIYPIGKSSNYSFKINLDKGSTNFYSIIKKDDKILIFLLDGILAENIDNFNYKYKDTESSIQVSSNSILFVTEKKRKLITFPYKIQKFTCGSLYYIDYVLIQKDDNEQLIAYNVLNNKSKIFKGKKIKILKNEFTILKNSDLYEEVIEEYKIDEEGLKIKNKSFSLTNRKLSENLTAFYFMNAIQNNDYTNAYTSISEDLKKNISEIELKNYFGDISYFYFIDQKTCFAISNNNNKIYEFIIKDNKINEILDND